MQSRLLIAKREYLFEEEIGFKLTGSLIDCFDYMNSNTLHPMMVAGLVFWLSSAALCVAVVRGAPTEGFVMVPGTSDHIAITDCVRVIRDRDTGVARVDRVLHNARGYGWDAPGARIRFRTDSASVEVHLIFSAKHIGPARNSVGFYRIDGQANDGWRFTRPKGATLPGDDTLNLVLPVPTGAGFHDYELILPYGDSVDLKGVTVVPTARWETPAARPKTRWVAFGDSVTHGFTSSAVVHSYPFQVGEMMNWEVINAGIGGRGCMASDGALLAEMNADVFSIMIGVNNWQGGTGLDAFRAQMTGLVERLMKGRPRALIYVITPLWVAPSWKPATATHSLEDYRIIIREVVAWFATERLHVIEGPSLIDEDSALFDKVSVHPNDAGFAQMADRLVKTFNR
ncbi:MAG: GDSL-type esterase/lipase family protein [Opitutaceae bacterium]|jgi:lysophospholipase L1-like esterase